MTTPRKSKVITFSLPPQMAEQVRQLMQEEGRTMSELIREALRVYMDERGVAATGTPPTGRGPPERTAGSRRRNR